MSKDHLELVSPNGKNKITLAAQDGGCGIWLQAEGKPSLSLHVGFHEGAVIGFRKVANPDGPYDAAISITEDSNKFHIQLLDKDKNLHFPDLEVFE